MGRKGEEKGERWKKCDSIFIRIPPMKVLIQEWPNERNPCKDREYTFHRIHADERKSFSSVLSPVKACKWVGASPCIQVSLYTECSLL